MFSGINKYHPDPPKVFISNDGDPPGRGGTDKCKFIGEVRVKRCRERVFLFLACFTTIAVAATVPSGTNLALGLTPNASCLYGASTPSDLSDDYKVTGMTDGTREGNGINATFASCHNNDDTLWDAIGFSTPQTVGSVAIFWAFNGNRDDYMAPQEVDFFVYTGGAWVLKTVEYPAQGDATFYSDSLTVSGWDPAVSVDSVKIAMPPLMGWMGLQPNTYNNILWVREFEIYAAPGTGTPPAAMSPMLSSKPVNFSMTTSEQKGATRFNVRLPQHADYRLTVYNVSGKSLWSQQATSQTRQISWDHRNATGGVYVAVLHQGDRTYSHKFMIRQ